MKRKNRLPLPYATRSPDTIPGYFSGYLRPDSVQNQIDIIRSHWPVINPDRAIRFIRNVYPTLQLPSWIEGPFVQIRPGFFSNVYREELQEVLKALTNSRSERFFNHCEKQIGNFRRSSKLIAAYHRITDQQPNSDLLIVPAQFGKRYRGCSVDQVRKKITIIEFGEGIRNGAVMLLTNPNRLRHVKDLWLDLPGDEVLGEITCSSTSYHTCFRDTELEPTTNRHFAYAPCLTFSADTIALVKEACNRRSTHTGSISAIAL